MKTLLKKLLVLLLLVPFLGLGACTHWSNEISRMETTWKSETPEMVFTLDATQDLYGICFGYAIDANGDKVDILFHWAAIPLKFFIHLSNGETDRSKIFEADNVVLSGYFEYQNRRTKKVKLTIDTQYYEDKLFNGLYNTIIVTAVK